jgi:hypothetical protein
LNEDRLFRLISRGIDGTVALGHAGLIVVAVVWLGFYAKEVLIAFAGKETAANLSINLDSDPPS